MGSPSLETGGSHVTRAPRGIGVARTLVGGGIVLAYAFAQVGCGAAGPRPAAFTA